MGEVNDVTKQRKKKIQYKTMHNVLCKVTDLSMCVNLVERSLFTLHESSEVKQLLYDLSSHEEEKIPPKTQSQVNAIMSVCQENHISITKQTIKHKLQNPSFSFDGRKYKRKNDYLTDFICAIYDEPCTTNLPLTQSIKQVTQQKQKRHVVESDEEEEFQDYYKPKKKKQPLISPNTSSRISRRTKKNSKQVSEEESSSSSSAEEEFVPENGKTNKKRPLFVVNEKSARQKDEQEEKKQKENAVDSIDEQAKESEVYFDLDEPDVFVVEAIIDKRPGKKVTYYKEEDMYLVKWRDYDETSWEPQSNIPVNLITHFNNRLKERKGMVLESILCKLSVKNTTYARQENIYRVQWKGWEDETWECSKIIPKPLIKEFDRFEKRRQAKA